MISRIEARIIKTRVHWVRNMEQQVAHRAKSTVASSQLSPNHRPQPLADEGRFAPCRRASAGFAVDSAPSVVEHVTRPGRRA